MTMMYTEGSHAFMVIPFPLVTYFKMTGSWQTKLLSYSKLKKEQMCLLNNVCFMNSHYL